MVNPIGYLKQKKHCENFHFDLDNSGNPITDDIYKTGLIAQVKNTS